jgi:preprotein translocase subunit SecF
MDEEQSKDNNNEPMNQEIDQTNEEANKPNSEKLNEDIKKEEIKKIDIEKKEEEQRKNEEKEKKKEEKQKKEQEPKETRKKFLSSAWYDKNYKKLLVVWIIISLLIIGQLIFMVVTKGDIMNKDVSLTGGTVISVYTEQNINTNELSSFLSSRIKEEVFIRTLNDITKGKQIAFVVETKAQANETKTALEEYLKYSLTSENSTTEVSGSSLSSSFYKQLLIALALAFVFMGIVVFIIFKKPIPSLAVIQCGVFDTMGALVIANIFGMRMSTAGIAALLMLAGYSVDTDTLLTTRVLKRKGEAPLNSRIKSAFKTGIIMTLTSLVAVLIAYFIVPSPVLKQIFFMISAGLVIDILGTWVGNAAILKWYCEKKKIS